MKRTKNILIAVFMLVCMTANAQVYSLKDAYKHNRNNDATYNIGIFGGLNATYWAHFGGTRYGIDMNNITKCLGYTGGLSLEGMITPSFSVGFEAAYAQRNVNQIHSYTLPVSLGVNNDYSITLNAAYSEMYFQIPFTVYLGPATWNVRPYVYAAPRVTAPLSGTIKKTINNITGNATLSEEGTTMGTASYKGINVGAAIGMGVQGRLNTQHYYYLFKFDVSAHAGLLSTNPVVTDEETQPVVVLPSVGPNGQIQTLDSKRYCADVLARITIMFPLKKRARGACVSWGEY